LFFWFLTKQVQDRIEVPLQCTYDASPSLMFCLGDGFFLSSVFIIIENYVVGMPPPWGHNFLMYIVVPLTSHGGLINFLIYIVVPLMPHAGV